MYIDFTKREIICFIVYCGSSFTGKSTSIRHIYEIFQNTNSNLAEININNLINGEIIIKKYGNYGFAIEADIIVPTMKIPDDEYISDFNLVFRLQSTIGNCAKKPFNKVMLSAADAIIFVADSREYKMDLNQYSKYEMTQFLSEIGRDLNKVPYALQLNFRDAEPGDLLSVDELLKELRHNNEPYFEAIAYKGVGVIETFNYISKIVFQNLQDNLNKYY